MPKLVCVNGSPRRVSRTGLLVDHIAEAIQRRTPAERVDVGFANDGAAILSGLDRLSLSPEGVAICLTVESADLLIVASPVYRGGYSGLLKHLFDLVDRATMRGKMAVLAATGGSPLHGLVLEHQFRPLMGFFGIQTAATALYGLVDDFGPGGELAAPLAERVEIAADEIVSLLDAQRSRHTSKIYPRLSPAPLLSP